MNEHIEIKKMLARYYEGESTDADEQRLRQYFISDNAAAELQPYCSIFAYIQHEKQSPPEVAPIITLPAMQPRRVKWWYAAAVAACLLFSAFLARQYQPASQSLCVGTYVMVNGVCYDDLALVRKYATETIDQITKPFGDGSATDALDFLDEE